ncbi:conserved hypothetical protein (plasmid) [Candidatus Protochlamydia naegleriophila]|uniref:Helix-turn-helix domain-containing protein n=1 Tax=Candidatus Protochlamydia naegleriophila TaxID=389348 RepID=A0A0U5JK09_9BACT|nr:helix-turn-helix domain-containing protein [Candidatus Protochlamydia naegleriophila]CUI18134.1 conserved hypothetical protein [Candidatus Protochlamydia naegleriophila]
MATLLQETSPVLPKEHDISLAKQSSRELAAILPKKEKDLSIKIENSESSITLPFSVVKLLVGILSEMAEGNAVTLIPIHAELTTQEAANLLNVSRPYLIKLLKKGEIPFHFVGTHRRVLFTDLKEFKEKSDKTSQQALEELTNQAQELDMGY